MIRSVESSGSVGLASDGLPSLIVTLTGPRVSWPDAQAKTNSRLLNPRVAAESSVGVLLRKCSPY